MYSFGCRLLSAARTVNFVNEPSCARVMNISADLVVEDGVSQVFREICHGGHVRSLIVVSVSLLRKKLQLVLYLL
jgi:hypothetical protein